MPANLEGSAVATGLEKVLFHSNPKERKCQRMFKLPQLHSSHTLAKWCSKFSKPGFNSTWTVNFQMFKLDLDKAEEQEIKLPTSARSSKKQDSSRNTSISALLTMPKSLCGSKWTLENSERDGNTDHLTCFSRNLYAGQEETVRIGYGTTDWFQTGKGVHQGCMLSPCLFNLYAEYIMRNTGCMKHKLE